MRLALAVVTAALFAAAPALAALPVKTAKIAEKHKEYEISVAYPRTGNKAIDAETASWAKKEIADFRGEAAGNDGDGSGLDADTLDGVQPAETATASTVVKRNSSGYVFGTYFNQSSGAEATAATNYIYERGDGYFRKKSLANVRAELITNPPQDIWTGSASSGNLTGIALLENYVVYAVGFSNEGTEVLCSRYGTYIRGMSGLQSTKELFYVALTWSGTTMTIVGATKYNISSGASSTLTIAKVEGVC